MTICKNLVFQLTTKDDYSYDTIVFKKEFHKLMFLSIGLHDFQFKVCIKQCKQNPADSISSAFGIIIDLFTWFDFFFFFFQESSSISLDLYNIFLYCE